MRASSFPWALVWFFSKPRSLVRGFPRSPAVHSPSGEHRRRASAGGNPYPWCPSRTRAQPHIAGLLNPVRCPCRANRCACTPPTRRPRGGPAEGKHSGSATASQARHRHEPVLEVGGKGERGTEGSRARCPARTHTGKRCVGSGAHPSACAVAHLLQRAVGHRRGHRHVVRKGREAVKSLPEARRPAALLQGVRG